MSTRIHHDCGCAECGPWYYACAEHKDKPLVRDMHKKPPKRIHMHKDVHSTRARQSKPRVMWLVPFGVGLPKTRVTAGRLYTTRVSARSIAEDLGQPVLRVEVREVGR